MQVLETRVDRRSERFAAEPPGHARTHRRASTSNRPLPSRGGGRRYVERHRQRGKLLARERIELLLDRDSPFLELSPLAGVGHRVTRRREHRHRHRRGVGRRVRDHRRTTPRCAAGR